ncbi:recombination-associated protein RdgC [Desulfococcus sp.]|uniref:recombination-associated protein RdgC n=1 Tax=Desulfococcus sp. TaxID=2025834 RepID=UPI003D0F3420
MGILSSTVSITRYRVDGKIEAPVLENITRGLAGNAITEIDDEASEKSVGWTALENPFRPDFSGSSFVIGAYLVFSLRIDKKTIPAKIVKKHYQIALARRMTDTGRDHLTKSEKQEIKEGVVQGLSMRIPATPNVFDVLWNIEGQSLWFYSTQKAANEELETLFAKSFKCNLIRLFPYTVAELTAGLSDVERDALATLTPTRFAE